MLTVLMRSIMIGRRLRRTIGIMIMTNSLDIKTVIVMASKIMTTTVIAIPVIVIMIIIRIRRTNGAGRVRSSVI